MVAPAKPRNAARRKASDVAWAPQFGPQTALLECPLPDLFYGGARGGGKTDGLIGIFIQQAGKYGADAKGIIFRRSYLELEQIESRAKEILVPLGWKHNETKHNFLAPNGALLKLRYLARNKDADNYQGHAYTFMGFDEAGNFPTPAPIDLLWGSLRSAAGVPCIRRITGNPGGPGHHWLRERYIDRATPFTPFRYQPQPEEKPTLFIDAVFIPARLDDNILLQENDPDYESRLAAAGGKALFKSWRYGDWDAVPGATFEEWRADVHVRAVEPQADWPAAAGMDWGYKSPGWFGLAFCGPDRQLHWRREYYFKKTPPYKVGYEIGQSLKRWGLPLPQYIALDSAAFAVTDGSKSIALNLQAGLDAALGQLTLPFVAAPKGAGSRKSSKALLHELLAWGPELEDGTVPSWLLPKMTIHPDCRNLVRTLPTLPPDPNDSEDVDTDAEDHAYDGVRYLVMTHHPEAERRTGSGGNDDTHPGIDKSGRRRKQPYERQAERDAEPVSEWTRRWSRSQPEDYDE